MLRRIFGLRRDEVTGGWRKLYIEELHTCYSLPNIIKVITSRRMKLAEDVVLRRKGMYIGCWWESQKERDH
jgi:hypothetical protein